MKMKIKLPFMIIYFIFLINSFSCESVPANKGSIKKELEFALDNNKNLTDNLISFSFLENSEKKENFNNNSENFNKLKNKDTNQEITCNANNDLFERQILFKIPKEYLICSYDYFPFKIEIKEGIVDFLSKKYSYSKDTFQLISKILFAYDLMYLLYDNKIELNENLIKSKQSSHIVHPSSQILNYINSLPGKEQIFNIDMFDEDDKMLYNSVLLNFKNDLFLETFEHVKNFIKSKYPKIENNILPWISDRDLFKVGLSIITSRSFDIDLNKYELIKNQTLIYMQMGYKRREKLMDVYSVPGFCLIPAFDLCNKKFEIVGNKENKKKEKSSSYELIATPNFIKIAFTRNFKKGDRIYFINKPNFSNDELLNNYGIIVKNNPYSTSYFNMNIDKINYTPNKNDICTYLGCFDTPLNEYFTNEKLNEAKIVVPINKNLLNKRILNAIRLFVLPEDKVNNNESFLYKTLYSGKVISMDNELMAMAKYRTDILISPLKINLEDILYSIQITKNYFKNNYERNLDSAQKYKYELRKIIMKVAREDKFISYSNIDNTQKEIKKIISDQFRKIRDYYANN